MSVTRREILASFLGAPFALSACRQKQYTSNYTGELFGPNVHRGHTLRSISIPDLRRLNLPSERVRVAVIGAGPAGLSAAWRLARAGFTTRSDLVVLELENDVGGTSRSGNSTLTRYPWGAHYVPVPSLQAKALTALLNEIGIIEGYENDGTPIVAEEVLCRAPEERLYYRGYWYEGLYPYVGASPQDLKELKIFRSEIERWSVLRDGKGRPAFSIPISKSSFDVDVLALDAMSMSEWMARKELKSTRLQWFVNYACRDDYGLSMSDTSAWAGLFYFVSRQARNGKAAPLMTWPDGNGFLVRYLSNAVQSMIRTHVLVADIAQSETNQVSILMQDEKNNWRIVLAERVIVATPRFVTRHLVSSLKNINSQELEANAFDYGSWAVANIHLSNRPLSRGVPLAWDNVFYDSPSLGYVVATHQTGLDHGPSVWTWYYPLTDIGIKSREKLLNTTWAEWADIAIHDVSRAHSEIHRYANRVDIWRWGHAMVRPRIGARRALLELDPTRPIGSIHFAHTDLSGVALFEEAHEHGVRAAEEVLLALKGSIASIR